ncbi:sacsin-like [Oratosquilla oratoria]|uniref:sacsin-like n=1 Tax=Oratosquilla oratoria TaxID=337810 RepID=UPI003F75CF91
MDPEDFVCSAIKTPSVVGLLKNILCQYPDNGQIIKELVQNGEDAEARTIEVLHIQYTFQCQQECIRRFVEGPALCLYNDAVFSEEDWQGIRMLSDSIKKINPVKVGQFGLGFKSVFHMTDYVTIISGDSVLFMDPSEPELTMCRKTNLKTLIKYVSESECLTIWGNVHLSREHLLSGIFPGTIFWFPLRQKLSQLSKTVYTRERVADLFASFGAELPFTLTFLKSLESIALFDCKSVSDKSIFQQINLESKNISKLRNQRNDFLRKLNHWPQANAFQNLMYTVEIKHTSGNALERQKICILHYLPNFSEMQDICNDAENVGLPLVGVAASLNEVQDGKLFCFLPLPFSSDNSTNLPVQVNGAFVLDHNRQHIKWKSEENGNLPEVYWNEKMVAEIIPEAYVFLLKALLKGVKENKISIQTFYRLLPDISVTSGRWRELALAVWQKFLHKSFLYSEAKMKMMKPCDVVSTHTLNLEPAEVKDAVIKTLTELGTPLSTFPESLLQSLNILEAKPKAVTPNLLRTHLKAGNTRVYDVSELLLQFILIDGEYSDLKEVPLLPLANSQWICFNKRSSTVYLCSEQEKEVFKGLEHKILRTTQTTTVQKALREIAKSGTTQLKEFSVQYHGTSLLKESVAAIMKNPGMVYDLTLWLKQVWCLIQPLPLRNVSDLKIVPTSDPPNISSLVPLAYPIIVQRPRSHLSKTASESLRCFYVHVVDLPPYIKHCEISEFLSESSSSGINLAILKALRLYGESQLIEGFNLNSSEDMICSLINIIDFHNMETTLLNFFRKLKLFLRVKGKSEGHLALNECSEIWPSGTRFPINIPKPFIEIRGPKELEFAKWLGAREMSEVDLCCLVLDLGSSSLNELFLFIVKSPYLSSNEDVLARLRNKKFVPNQKGILHKPSDLYRPDESWSEALRDEDCFPSSNFNHHLEFLKTLGLKSCKDIPKQTLVNIIRSVSNKTFGGADLSRKVYALLALVNDHNDCAEISRSVVNTPFVQGALQPSSCTLNLPWATCTRFYKPSEIKSLEKFEEVIGCVYPLIACKNFPNIERNFGWDIEPTVDVVIQQLDKIVQYYKEEYLQNPDFICLVERIYEVLTLHCETPKKEYLKKLHGKECILTDYGFKKPSEVYIKSGQNDLKLVPFVYSLHRFLKQRSLFRFLGAYQEQMPAMFVSVLVDIHEAHKSGRRGVNELDSDRYLIGSILQRLLLHLEDVNKSELLLPVESANDTLEMEMAENCTYSDKSSEWLQDIEEMGIKIVHNSISPTLAKALGVDPLNKHLFKEQEAIMQWEQNEPLTTRIHNLLRHYRDGLAVLKELVQNADDAGAQEIGIMYDEREGLEARSNLISKDLADFQGPALWAYNDAEFTNEDLKNIIKLGGATKGEQSTKIGKFGLGFCSVYNITDVPSFVTGSNYVIFDPHMKHNCELSGPSGGMKYDLSKKFNKIMLRRLNDQLKPFQDVFKFDMNEGYFKGSLFRLPLRTRMQAEVSEISEVVYGHSEMVELLSMFMKMAGNLLLFTQSIKEIKVYHLGPSVSSPKDANILLHIKKIIKGRFTIQQDIKKTLKSDHTQMQYAFNVLNKAEIFNYNELVYADIKLWFSEYAEKLCSLTKNYHTVEWLVSWNSGFGEAIKLARKMGHGTLPLAAVAIPVLKTNGYLNSFLLEDLPTGFYQKSHMHCFLPLPIPTGFSVHINGYFQVASDRTSLTTVTEDDRGYVNWNKCLMRDAVIAAWFRLLAFFRQGINQRRPYHELWPLRLHAKDELYLEMVDSFYTVIVKGNLKVFRRDDRWCALSECRFLENQFLKESIAESASAFLSKCLEASNLVLVEIPENIVEGFLDSSFSENIITSRTFFLEYFLPNVICNYITVIEKENLMLYILDNNDPEVLGFVRNKDCIPTLPKYKLRRPSELVNPEGLLAKLYDNSDERFPTEAFTKSHRMDVLITLGMLTSKLTMDMVKERIQVVSALGCSSCAIEHTQAIMNYMACHLQQTKQIASAIRETKFLPVMKKPKDWSVSWKGSSCSEKPSKPCDKHKAVDNHCLTFSLCSPKQAYSSELKDIVGGIEIVHQNLGEQRSGMLEVWKALEIPMRPKEVPLQVAIEQLQLVSSEVQEVSSEWCNKVIRSIYKCIDKSVANGKYSLEKLRNEKILLTKVGFKKPSQFALSEESHCSPEFFCASTEDLHWYKHFLKALGIQQRHDPKTILSRLQEKGSKLRGKKLPEEEVQKFSRLLNFLFSELMSSNLTISLESILLPDEDLYLQCTKELCFMDDMVVERGLFRFVHQKIALSRDMADKLGILTTTRKRYQQSSHRISFGQKEPLTTRIRNILKDYPCDNGIMKELLQNADDAGATEICFIKDFRNHPTEKLFSPGWSELQGPALCIYNNGSFTEEDLESIQKLGDSNKIYDPITTGQYGIGFNAVYHLTDAPSFLTKGPKIKSGETLCMFDPHCWFDEEATPQYPGVRLTGLEDLRVSNPNNFRVYLEESVMNKEGTLFRLPLRLCKGSEISKEVMSTQKVNDLIKEFSKDMKKCLLFLRSIRKISIASINDNGILDIEYSVEASIDDEAKTLLKSLTDHIKSYRSCKESNLTLYKIPRKTVAYKLHISDSKGCQLYWYVVQQIGTNKPDSVPKVVEDVFRNGSLCMLPHGGVALLLKYQAEEVLDPKKFMSTSCFLPLPVTSNLPFSVNGHFALDATRRDLWVGEDYRTIWNKWLVKEVIAPTVVQALCFWKKHKFQDQEILKLDEYKRRICKYYSVFPHKRNVCEIWEELASSVYFHIKTEKSRLFDVYIPMKDKIPPKSRNSGGQSSSQDTKDDDCGTVEWWPLEHEESEFPLYFDNLSKEYKNEHFGESKITMCFNVLDKYKASSERFDRVVNSLKWHNMKISSKEAYDLLYKADVKVQGIDPNIVLDFLHSWTEKTFGSCNITLSIDIKETGFQSISTVCDILKFVSHAENFSERVNNLPLLVTEDSLLQIFSEDLPVFVSEYSSLLPEIKKKFVHSDMVMCIQALFEKLRSSNMVREFGLEDLIDNLQGHYSTFFCKEKIKLNWEEKKLVKWLKKFWEFVSSSHEKLAKKPIEWEQRKNIILNRLGDWALYPTSDDNSVYIIPVNMAKYTLAPTSTNIKLFSKLSLPFATCFTERCENCTAYKNTKLDSSHRNTQLEGYSMHHTRCKQFIDYSCTKSKLMEFCTDDTKPSFVVELMYFHRKLLFKDASSKGFVNLAKNIVQYVANNCNKVDKLKMKSLPLFEDVEGNICSLESTTPIISHGVPKYGLHEMGKAAGFVLLKEEHDCIYRVLVSDCIMTPVTVYEKYILPRLKHICQKNVIKHIDYLRRNMYEYVENSSLKDVLKKTPFILYNSEYVTADVFTDHEVLVFRMMSPEKLPNPWVEKKWKEFLKVAGMKHKVTPDLFIGYAQQLKSCENYLEKSKVLVEYFFSNFSDFHGSIERVSTLEFLVPEIKPRLGKLLPCFKTTSGFTSFKEGIEQKFAEMVWSKASLLPSYAEPPNEEMKSGLQVQCKPPDRVMIDHLQSFCKFIVENGVPSDEEFENVMDKIYGNLKKCNDSVIENLKADSIIHIPNHNVMVAPGFVVEELNEEILPYLYKAPKRYGKFSDVFQKLGIQESATATIYANILEYIYNNSGGKKLNPEESRKLKIVLKQMTKLLPEMKSLNGSYLFLPSVEETLVKSSDMYFADIRLPHLAKNILDKPVMFELRNLDIGISTSGFVSHLPNLLKPVLLSTAVVEEFDSSTAVEVDTSLLRQVTEYLGSDVFRHSCMRLVNDKQIQEGSRLTSGLRNKVSKIINSVFVIQVQEIEVRYMYKLEEVSRQKKLFFLQNSSQNGGMRKLYISKGISEQTLTFALKEAFMDLQKFMGSEYLLFLYTHFKEPHELWCFLDNLDVKPYEEGEIMLPFDTTPGTYLHTDFIHMLDNDFHTLDKGEIVAMKRYLIDGEEDVFIIVKVLRVVSQNNSLLMQEYEVESGYETFPTVKVKGHQLYRFVRNKLDDDSNKKLVPTGEEPETVHSESEIMEKVKKQVIEIWKVTDEKEKRHLLRRLVLKWHPDKNPDRIELCTRVVQYIHMLISRLERGENIEDEPNKARSYSSASYEDIFRTPPRYYTRPSRSSRFSRSRSYPRSKHSDRPQTKLWMQQADHDLQEAKDHEERGSSCWIVYMCHQASEKAIIAALFFEDRDTAAKFQNGPFNRSLSEPAKLLTSPELLLSLCQEMEARIQKHVNMRYPIYGSAPCNVYDRCDASFMIQKASKLITLVKERFGL